VNLVGAVSGTGTGNGIRGRTGTGNGIRGRTGTGNGIRGTADSWYYCNKRFRMNSYNHQGVACVL